MYSAELNTGKESVTPSAHPFHVVTDTIEKNKNIIRFATNFNKDISNKINNHTLSETTLPNDVKDNFSNTEKTHDAFILSLYPFLDKDPELAKFANNIREILESDDFTIEEKIQYIKTGQNYILEQFKKIFNNKYGKVPVLISHTYDLKINTDFLDPNIKTFILLKQIIKYSNINSDADKKNISNNLAINTKKFIKDLADDYSNNKSIIIKLKKDKNGKIVKFSKNIIAE